MLVENLFQFKNIERTEGKLSSQVEINASNSIFEGHFPNNPITPGVMQVQLVTDILENHFGRSLVLSTMDRCKFLAILNPETTSVIDVDITLVEVNEEVKIKAIGKDANNIYFKFSALYI